MSGKGRNYVADIPPGADGRCIRPGCGILLFNDPADVPRGWIIIFHVNCGDHCPECATETEIGGCGQERAEYILGEYAPWESNGNKKTAGVDEAKIPA